jgi:hypothetical protein
VAEVVAETVVVVEHQVELAVEELVDLVVEVMELQEVQTLVVEEVVVDADLLVLYQEQAVQVSWSLEQMQVKEFILQRLVRVHPLHLQMVLQ